MFLSERLKVPEKEKSENPVQSSVRNYVKKIYLQTVTKFRDNERYFEYFYNHFTFRPIEIVMESQKKMVGQIADLRTNLIKFIRDYNATKLENENLTQLVANDEHKRKLEVSLNDCREKMHQFHSENLQKEGSIKDLEYKLSQITKENDEVVKKRDSAIEEIMNQLAIKANEYKTTHEKLVEAQSTAEIFAEKNANLKLDHETKIENLQVEIQKLKRYSLSLFP